MRVTVDGEGAVYVDLQKLPPGVRVDPNRVTHYLEKHGLLLYWDGSGTLLGVEFIPDGRQVEVRETALT